MRAVAARRSRAADGARVRVMTVHAAKGLEFDEVVLGALGNSLDDVRARSASVAIIPADDAGTPAAVGPVASLELVAHSPLLAAFRAESETARLGDALSALYVGLTRAKEAVHLVCPPPTKEDTPSVTACWMLRRSVGGFETAYLAAAARLPGPVTFVTFDAGQIPVAMSLGFAVESL